MNELIVVENGKPVTTSRKIAALFGKGHKDVLRDIIRLSDRYKEMMPHKMEYVDSRGRVQPEYQLSMKEAILLVAGYNCKHHFDTKEHNVWRLIDILMGAEARHNKNTNTEQRMMQLLSDNMVGSLSENVMDFLCMIKSAVDLHTDVEGYRLFTVIMDTCPRILEQALELIELGVTDMQHLERAIIRQAARNPKLLLER